MSSIDIEFYAGNKNLWFAYVSSLFSFSSGHSAREHLVNTLFDGPPWLFCPGCRKHIHSLAMTFIAVLATADIPYQTEGLV